MKKALAILAVVGGLLLAVTSGLVSHARPMMQPTIEGNYILESRALPDGKMVRPPEIAGMMTFTKTHRNFNVYWKADGKPVSISTISRYAFDGKQYTEESLYYMENLPGSSTGIAYNTKSEKGSSPVRVEGGSFGFKLPLHEEPDVVFAADGMTATRAGVFVDHWKKVE